MTDVLCEKHGVQTTKLISNSLRTALFGTTEQKLMIVELTLHLPFGSTGVFSVDQSFVKSKEIGLEITDEELAFDIYSDLVPICQKCFDELTSDK